MTTANSRHKFTVQTREETGKGAARKLRAQGLIPGVCYGFGTESMAITADPDELYKLLTSKKGTNLVFELEVKGADTFSHVMVRDYQIDPVRRELRHADFVVIDPKERLQVRVPIESEGKPAGVREGGRLQMVRNEVDLWCDPDAIPERIVHNVSHLGLGDSVLASELELPEGVEPAYTVDYAVARVHIPRGLEVTATAEEELEEGLVEGEEVEGEEGEEVEGAEEVADESEES